MMIKDSEVAIRRKERNNLQTSTTTISTMKTKMTISRREKLIRRIRINSLEVADTTIMMTVK